MTINNEQEHIIIEFNNGDQQRYSKPAFAPTVKVEEIENVSNNTSRISNKTVIDLDELISKTIDAIRSQVLKTII